MNAHTEQILLKKLNSLPPARQAEAEDFIDFLSARAREERVTETAIRPKPQRKRGVADYSWGDTSRGPFTGRGDEW